MAVITPQLETERLTLRQLALSDAVVIRELAGEREVAARTLNIPHPYPEGAAEDFIYGTQFDMKRGNGYIFGIERKADGQFVGVVGLTINAPHSKAELGYWIGMPFWNQGYATEAAKRMIQFGFEELKLNRISANYFTNNYASRKVMDKCGMIFEGTMREHLLKWGEFKDVGFCAILREHYEQRKAQSS